MQPFFPPELEQRRAQYAALEGAMQPLMVTAQLDGPAYLPDPLYLDSLLAAAVVREVYESSLIPDVPLHHSPVVPMPLQTLWRDERGYPFTACTAFQPDGHIESDVYYHHKRHHPGTFTKRAKTGQPFSVKSTDGRWMDRQRPLTTQVVERLICTAVGDFDEICRLLVQVTHIGKERSRGIGRVRQWNIVPASEFSLVQNGRLAANVPYAAARALGLKLPPQLTQGAWTAPRWQNGAYSLVHPVGTVAG